MQDSINRLLSIHHDVRIDLSRSEMIREVVKNGEALVASCGCLATWTPPESTGRSPKDTVFVRRAASENIIDWESPNCLPITSETFDMLFEDTLDCLNTKSRIYVTHRSVGADSRITLPVETISSCSLTALFTDNMFRPVPADIDQSIFSGRGFTVLVVPYDKLNPGRYDGRLRINPSTGKTTSIAIATDFVRRIGIVFGSSYMGSVKKLIFTVMNYYLPLEGVLSLHCSANEGRDGNIALLLGLSGTGKTTLSADPGRALLGDDEHAWSDHGISNFEYGCYAKLVKLDPRKEPEIFRACFQKDDYLHHGVIIENAMMYPNGEFDLFDERLTPNSRGSYPLKNLTNTKASSMGKHPKTILFLTADANGIIPPVAKLNLEQAMLWFLMGYTSKLAGTETGVVDPKSTFSRFFGEPFMPLNPDIYARMLGDKMRQHQSRVYLINTGWSGGPYGTAERMDINLTRRIVTAALNGDLELAGCREDHRFHLSVPTSCPGLDDPSILTPEHTWRDQSAFEERANRLAAEFSAHFEKAYGNKNINASIRAQCPGK
jgi:phosphoenolpyruvate carboxykinase (ATP)